MRNVSYLFIRILYSHGHVKFDIENINRVIFVSIVQQKNAMLVVLLTVQQSYQELIQLQLEFKYIIAQRSAGCQRPFLKCMSYSTLISFSLVWFSLAKHKLNAVTLKGCYNCHVSSVIRNEGVNLPKVLIFYVDIPIF